MSAIDAFRDAMSPIVAESRGWSPDERSAAIEAAASRLLVEIDSGRWVDTHRMVNISTGRVPLRPIKITEPYREGGAS